MGCGCHPDQFVTGKVGILRFRHEVLGLETDPKPLPSSQSKALMERV
jgi:hypothetical protein